MKMHDDDRKQDSIHREVTIMSFMVYILLLAIVGVRRGSKTIVHGDARQHAQPEGLPTTKSLEPGDWGQRGSQDQNGWVPKEFMQR